MDTKLDKEFKEFMYNYQKKISKEKSHILFPSSNILKKKVKLIHKKKVDPTDILESKCPSIKLIKIKKVMHQNIKNDNKSSFSIDNYENFKKKNKTLVNDVLQDKTFYQKYKRKPNINSLIERNIKGNKPNYTIKSINASDINRIHNLHLIPIEKYPKKPIRMTKVALLINLYNKYSSVISSNSINNENKNSFVRYFSKDNKNNKKTNSQLYITNIDDNYNFNEIFKRKLNSVNMINKKIIKRDNNIFVNCLLSKVYNINRKKILLNNFSKTLYNMYDERSYLRIKNLDNIFSKILKS